MGGGMRPDPLFVPSRLSDTLPSRVSASYLRGFRLLPKGVFPVGKMRRSDSQNILASTETQVAFDTRDHDTTYDDGQQQSGAEMCDLANDQLVIRFAGYWEGCFYGLLAGGGAGSRRLARIFKNTTTVIGSGGGFVGPAADGTPLYAPFAGNFAVGDTIEVKVFHDDVGTLALLALNDGPRLEARWQSL